MPKHEQADGLLDSFRGRVTEDHGSALDGSGDPNGEWLQGEQCRAEGLVQGRGGGWEVLITM